MNSPVCWNCRILSFDLQFITLGQLSFLKRLWIRKIMKVGEWQFLGILKIVPVVEVQQTMKTASSDEELAFKQKQKDMATYTKKVRWFSLDIGKVGWFVDGEPTLTSMLVKLMGNCFWCPGMFVCDTCLYSCKSQMQMNGKQWKDYCIEPKLRGTSRFCAVWHPSVNPTYSFRLWGHDTLCYFWRVGWNLMIRMRCQ